MAKASDIQDALSKLSKDDQHFAKAMAQMKLENRIMTEQLIELKKQHKDLWRVMIVILDACTDKELRIHDSQFKRFEEEYRIDKSYDEETREVVLKLATFNSNPITH